MGEYSVTIPRGRTDEQIAASLRREIEEGIQRISDPGVRRSIIDAAFEIADRQLQSADVQSDFIEKVCNGIPQEELRIFVPILASIAGLSRNLNPLKDLRTFLERLQVSA